MTGIWSPAKHNMLREMLNDRSPKKARNVAHSRTIQLDTNMQLRKVWIVNSQTAEQLVYNSSNETMQISIRSATGLCRTTSCEPVCRFVINGNGDYEISTFHINKSPHLHGCTITGELQKLQTYCDSAVPPISLVFNDAGGRARADHMNVICNMSLKIHINIGIVASSSPNGASKGSLTATGDIAFVIRWAGKDMRLAGWTPTTRNKMWTWTLTTETIDNPAYPYKGSILYALDCLEQDIMNLAPTASIAWTYSTLNYGEPPALIPVASFRLPILGHGRYDEYAAEAGADEADAPAEAATDDTSLGE